MSVILGEYAKELGDHAPASQGGAPSGSGRGKYIKAAITTTAMCLHRKLVDQMKRRVNNVYDNNGNVAFVCNPVAWKQDGVSRGTRSTSMQLMKVISPWDDEVTSHALMFAVSNYGWTFTDGKVFRRDTTADGLLNTLLHIINEDPFVNRVTVGPLGTPPITLPTYRQAVVNQTMDHGGGNRNFSKKIRDQNVCPAHDPDIDWCVNHQVETIINTALEKSVTPKLKKYVDVIRRMAAYNNTPKRDGHKVAV